MESHLDDIWMDVQGELLVVNAHQQVQRVEEETKEALDCMNKHFEDTGGRGGLTWQAHCGFVESF